MKRSFININSYKYLVEYYNANTDLKDNLYYADFVMLRNFNIVNNIVCDTDIYIIERSHYNLYVNELISSKSTYGHSLCFPVTLLKTNSYSNSYLKFNDNYNNNMMGLNSSIYIKDENNNVSIGTDVYEIYEIKNKKLKRKKIKCDKFRIYHPITKKNINAIIDINNYINNIHFHYLCRPIDLYLSSSETEYRFNNEFYSEFIEVYFPNIEDLFDLNESDYKTFYIENLNIVASTRNEKFINSILSSSKHLDHSEFIGDCQVVPTKLLIQPYRIIEEYTAESDFNYDDDVSNDEKTFVKLYLKTNVDINNNYFSFPLTLRLYPYSYADVNSKLYILDESLSSSAVSLNSEFKFNLMSRLGFSDGIISIVSLFIYPNKSYFYSLYKDDPNTTPIKEAYKHYNNVDDHNYMMFVNEEIEKELQDIDNIKVLTDEMRETVKEVANINYVDKNELLNAWKDLMKSSIINEYEEEFGMPGNFLGFKIDIATDINFKHVIYTKNVRVNFNDLDDFSFKLNGIFDKWEQRPDKLIVKCSFYDRVIGVEIKSNLIIITKEWFKYLINDVNVYRLSDLSYINKHKGEIDDMKVVDLNNYVKKHMQGTDYDDEFINNMRVSDVIKMSNDLTINNFKSILLRKDSDRINFINSINCIVNKKHNNESQLNISNNNSKIIFKPIFYKVNNLQNILIKKGLIQNIGINLSEYLSKVETFKIVIENKEYVEYGRTDIFVIFNINANNISGKSGDYHILNEDSTYIASGKWTKN